MKTVEEWLNEVDEGALADEYFWENPIDFVMLRDQNHTVAEIRRAAREQFIGYVRKLRAIAASPRKEGDKTPVFYASNGHRNHERGIVARKCGSIWDCRPRSRTRKRMNWRAGSLRRSAPTTCSAAAVRRQSCGSCSAKSMTSEFSRGID